jgi:hypothetical protein
MPTPSTNRDRSQCDPRVHVGCGHELDVIPDEKAIPADLFSLTRHRRKEPCIGEFTEIGDR